MSFHSMEEASALIGMEDTEMADVMLQFAATVRVSEEPQLQPSGCVEVRVRTDRGDLLVAVKGDTTKPAIVTYHDIGLNYTWFLRFFDRDDMRVIMDNFCIYHVTAPGQQDHAPTLPDNYSYPSIPELANELKYVLGHFGLRSVIGFGSGAGAHILSRFALDYPDKVDALALINCSATAAGWTEWFYESRNVRTLRNRGMAKEALDYFLWHHLGRTQCEDTQPLWSMHRIQLSRRMNPVNLAMFVDSYIARPDLGISRAGSTLLVPVLNLTASASPHVEDTVAFNGRLNPRNSTWMKISDCSSVLDEQPAKVSEAFRLFLQGEGYACLALHKVTSRSRSAPSSPARASPSAGYVPPQPCPPEYALPQPCPPEYAPPQPCRPE